MLFAPSASVPPFRTRLPTELAAPTTMLPAPSMRAVPVAPVKPKFALTVPPLARIVPLLLTDLRSVSALPAFACNVPELTIALFVLIVRPTAWSAAISPWLLRPIKPVPIWPPPRIVWPAALDRLLPAFP